jgi:hypothetical protein
MSLYAELPGRRTRQVLGDVLVLLWVAAWVAVGRAVHDAVARLAAPGRTLEEAGRSLADGLRDAAEGLGRTPLLGEELRAPVDSAGDAAATLARAGVDAQTGVGRAALVAAVAVAAWPVLLVVGAWVLRRWWWARRAAETRRVLAAPGGIDLLALRALVRAPLARLGEVGADPADGWRHADPGTVRALAALTLRDAGLRVPPVPRDVG